VMPHPMFLNAPDDEHDVRAARMRKPLTRVDELAQVGASGRSGGSRSLDSRTRNLAPGFVRCVDAKRKDKAPAYRETAKFRLLGDPSEELYRFEDLAEPLVQNPVRVNREEHEGPARSTAMS
jgi:hypothetical protein